MESEPCPESIFTREERWSRLKGLREVLGKKDGQILRISVIGAGAWGTVFAAMMQRAYGEFKDSTMIRIWRREGRAVSKELAEQLFHVINKDEKVMKRLQRACSYLKYVDARLGDKVLRADEILRDGFCVNMAEVPVCPLNVVTSLEEVLWDADIVVNALPSTDTTAIFAKAGPLWIHRQIKPIVISLSKVLSPWPHIYTPTGMIHASTGVPLENLMYLGGPNIAAEVYKGEYANARLCGNKACSVALCKFLSQPRFTVWANTDIVTHEVLGGLKNVYAIGSGIMSSLRGSATSSSVYFAHALGEMAFITHLIVEKPQRITGPLLADTYVTMLKGRNAWYGGLVAQGKINPSTDGDSFVGKGTIQGISAVRAFFELLSDPRVKVPDPDKPDTFVQPICFLPILQKLNKILHSGQGHPMELLDAIHEPGLLQHSPDAFAFDKLYQPKLLPVPNKFETGNDWSK